MKEYIQMAISIGSSLILLPILVLYINGMPIGSQSVVANEQIELMVDTEQEDVMDETTLVGILAKEVPYTYEIEALKAQAVVVRTYMARRILGIQNNGAIVGYTVEEMRNLWGESYEKIYNIYARAVQETRGKLILYNKKPIEAIYHVASSGKTRDAQSVYQVEVPYLKSVESSMDTISSQIAYTKEQVKEKIEKQYPDLVVGTENLENQIQIVEKDEAGYIRSIQIGNITMKGEEFKTLLELPSCAFKIHNSDEKLIFDIRGKGNGVGLSQNGANEMARQGKDYEQIITYYYTDVEIADYEFQK